MTMNNSTKTFRGQANCTVDHPSHFSLSTWLDPTIIKFMPRKHFVSPLWDNRLMGAEQKWQRAERTPEECPNVVGYRRSYRFNPASWLTEEKINCGRGGNRIGGLSVMMASLKIIYLLGFRRVYLLGVDFAMSATQQYHFAQTQSARQILVNNVTYAELQMMFSELQPLLLGAGFAVSNCNPTSKLNAFPFVSYEQALHDSGERLGDYMNERTEGMYDRGKIDKV